MTVEIVHGDTRDLPIADDTVDLIVTSPPYWSQRSYQDGGEHYDGQIGAEYTPAAYIDALIDATREWLRVLKPEGSLWVNLGDKYASAHGGGESALRGSSDGRTDRATQVARTLPRGMRPKSLMGLPWRYALRCIDELALILRAEVIWSKPNAMPESVTDRVRRSHETWFHFAQQPRYFSAVDEIREEHQAPGRSPGRNCFGGRDANLPRTATGEWSAVNPLGKIPSSVWEIATQPLKVPAGLGADHHAAFPIGWPRRIIAAWCPPGGVVLDPFGGTGTTALAADVLGRHGISVDASADYCRIAAWRTTDPGERARAMGVAKPEPEMEGQLSLLDQLEAAA